MSYILLIEDNPANADMIIRLLESANYTVRHFERGLDGMKAARQERPQMILVDFNLPDIDGTNVVLVLKQQFGKNNAPPFIAVTARASAIDEQYAMQVGCDAFVTKPLDPESFLALINEFLGTNKSVGQ